MKKYTVADYLHHRLAELGLTHLFGVAGNYTAPLLDTILADPDSKVALVNMPNELCAGYAADAYARLKGISAVAVTYSVGSFHLLNPIAGAFVEQIPIVVINGSLTNKEWINAGQIGLIYSHSLSDPMSNLNVFRQVTIAAERISNGVEAPFQIDAALSACVSRSGPVYLEVLEDVWRATCQPPAAPLPIGQSYVTNTSNESTLAQALEATKDLILKYQDPFFWVGSEVQRQKLEPQVKALLAATKKITYTTSVMGKGVIGEDSLLFRGVFTPPASDSSSDFYNTKGQLLGNCMIGLGAWMTSKDVAFHNITSDRVVLAAHTGVRVGSYFFPMVQLGDYIKGLKDILAPVTPKIQIMSHLSPALRLAKAPVTSMTYDLFFDTLQTWIRQDHCLIVDAGFPLLGATALPAHQDGDFICQASWLSIGYSVGAGVGAKCARPSKRALVIVGDGAFQQTCQSISAQHALGHNTVVFIIQNGIYGIEQDLVNPNPFRTGDQKIDYKEAIFNDVFSYNKLHDWNYDKITASMGGEGRTVNTVDALKAVLAEIDANPNANFVVAIRVPETDTPRSLKPKLLSTHPGEDEVGNPNWPSTTVF